MTSTAPDSAVFAELGCKRFRIVNRPQLNLPWQILISFAEADLNPGTIFGTRIFESLFDRSW